MEIIIAGTLAPSHHSPALAAQSPSKHSHLHACRLTLALSTLAILGGCASAHEQMRAVNTALTNSDHSTAATAADKLAEEKKDSRDALWWRLNQGLENWRADRVQKSLFAFDTADALIDKYDQEAETVLSREATTTFTNLTTLPYTGTTYDRIMVSTYKALIYIQLGDPDKARVELNRALDRQKNAVAENAKRIEKLQKKAAQESKKAQTLATPETVSSNPDFQKQFAENYPDLGSKYTGYSDYVNPFCVMLDALFFTYNAVDASDLARARLSLDRVKSLNGATPSLTQDEATLQAILNGRKPSATTYILFETGRAPSREEIKIILPILLQKVPVATAAFPRLKYNPDYLHNITISTSNNPDTTTDLLCNMDSVVVHEFKDTFPEVLTKTLISTIVKAGATYAAANEAGIFGSIAGAIYQIGTAQADLRTWDILPKEFRYARVNTPPDSNITIKAGALAKTVHVEAQGINIVYVYSLNQNSPLVINAFPLTKNKAP